MAEQSSKERRSQAPPPDDDHAEEEKEEYAVMGTDPEQAEDGSYEYYSDNDEEQEEAEDPDSGMCGICQKNFTSKDEVTSVPCSKKHSFHVECVKAWFSKGHMTCPVCKEQLKLK